MSCQLSTLILITLENRNKNMGLPNEIFQARLHRYTETANIYKIKRNPFVREHLCFTRTKSTVIDQNPVEQLPQDYI